MRWQIVLLIVVSVLLSSAAQLLLKFGAASPALQHAIGTKNILTIVWAMATSPRIFIGLACFGLSLVLWIVVLSRTDVSFAYPFVALGICITTFAGWFFFGEGVSPARMAGIGIIILGVLTVATSG